MACSTQENNGAWSKIAYITIWKCGESQGTEYAALTETIEIERGKKDVEYTATLQGGKVGKLMPQEDATITFEGYPLTVGGELSGNATGVDALFDGGPTWPTGDHKVLYATPYMGSYRISILWTDDTSSGITGAGSTAINTNAYRISFANAICTEVKNSFTDGILKTTFSFKASPINKFGIPNYRVESITANATSGLPALSEYNDTNYPQDGSPYTWE